MEARKPALSDQVPLAQSQIAPSTQNREPVDANLLLA